MELLRVGKILRLKRLKDIGIDFKHSFPGIKPIIFLHLKGKNQKFTLMFKDGVVFACRRAKEEVLQAFLHQINYKPAKIIFVDNQLKNIKSVEYYCKEQGIDYIGFHYNYARSMPKSTLNKRLIDYQFKMLETQGGWLSDDEVNLKLTER